MQGFLCILQQVVEQLPQAARIRQYLAVPTTELQSNEIWFVHILVKLKYISNEVVQAQELPVQRRFLGIITKSIDEIFKRINLGHDGLC